MQKLSEEFGVLLEGNPERLKHGAERLSRIPVDLDRSDDPPVTPHTRSRTIAEPTVVRAPGTFAKNQIRELRLEPYERPGWWFDRVDIPDSSPIRVSLANVWTTGDLVSNIVLRSGSPHNYVRLVEHIIAVRAGMDIDNLLIKVKSGDPPLFERGSLPLVEALEKVDRKEIGSPIRYVTVKEKISIVDERGGFTTLTPAKPGSPELQIDCTRDFSNAIGQQRIRFTLNKENFRFGSEARTNTSARQKLFCQTIGKIFADVRNLGYNDKNVVIAGKRRYVNEPRLMHNGKSLEAAWHRATLDLLAGLALIQDARFVGSILDYKGGHYMDVELVRMLLSYDLLEEVEVSPTEKEVPA